jgi:hypothetical protein
MQRAEVVALVKLALVLLLQAPRLLRSTACSSFHTAAVAAAGELSMFHRPCWLLLLLLRSAAVVMARMHTCAAMQQGTVISTPPAAATTAVTAAAAAVPALAGCCHQCSHVLEVRKGAVQQALRRSLGLHAAGMRLPKTHMHKRTRAAVTQ